MSEGYIKLFGSILDSTVWLECAETRVVWITMLAMADRDGEIHASVPGLAKRAGVSREACEAALAAFLAPDPDSRSAEHEGRRIAVIDGGWTLLNYAKYREKLSAEDQREKNAARQKRWRDRASRNVTRNAGPLRTVTNNESNDIAEAEAEAEARHTERAGARERVRVEPLIAEEPAPTTAQRIRAAWDARILAATAAPAAWPHKAGEHVRVLAEWIERLNPPDVDAAIAQLLDAYFREPWARQKAFPLGPLAGNPSRYWNGAEGRLEVLRRKADEIKAQKGICDEWRAAMDEWIAARKRLARDTEVSNGSN